MAVEYIIILVFILVMIILSFLYRNSTLKKLVTLQGEEIIFEETKVKVEQKGGPRTAVFYNSIVRVTNMRIIIAQKVLLGNTHVLRHVMNYSGFSSETDLKKTLARGYVVSDIFKSDMKITKNSEGEMIRISIPNSSLTRGQYIEFRTSMSDEYERLFM